MNAWFSPLGSHRTTRDRRHTQGRRQATTVSSRRDQDRRLRLAIDQLENRFALSLPGSFSIGGITEGTFLDTPTGLGSVSDQVTVSITGTTGTVVFNGGNGVADGSDIQTIDIIGASSDFQLTIGANVRTETPVPYGSDGVVQLGQITANTVIGGVNTVKGAATDVAVAPLPPLGFTVLGATSVDIGGDETGRFTNGTFVALTPLTTGGAGDGAPFFRTVTNSTYNGGTNTTTLTLDEAVADSVNQGAITTAARIEPSFVLTSFEGVNFSKGGGLFVDVVEGREGDNLGIQLSGGLIPEATIGIREQLDANVALGTTRQARADGRVFIESATEDSVIRVAPSSSRTSANSRFKLIGGEGEFSATVGFDGLFSGEVNLPGGSGGNFVFERGVAAQGVLSASEWHSVLVKGNFAGTINSTGSNSTGIDATGIDGDGGMFLEVTGNVAKTARVNSSGPAEIQVFGNVARGATIVADEAMLITVNGSVSGLVQAGGGVPTVGSVGASAIAGLTMSAGSLSGASIAAGGGGLVLGVSGNITKSTITSGTSGVLTVVIANTVQSSSISSAGPLTVGLNGSLTQSTVLSGSTSAVAANIAISRSTVVAAGDLFVSAGPPDSTSGDILNTRITGSGEGILVTAGRDVRGVTITGAGGIDGDPPGPVGTDVGVTAGRNVQGVIQSAAGDVALVAEGSVLKGSSLTAGDGLIVNVAGNFSGNATSDELLFLVGGNVAQASRITAHTVGLSDEPDDLIDDAAIGALIDLPDQNFLVGGRFDGILNVGSFDAVSNVVLTDVGALTPLSTTVIGGGVGKSGRLNIEAFAVDENGVGDPLVFAGNFQGNLRVGGDLPSDLSFTGNADRITISGRVLADIDVAGQLKWLNSNSYFLPVVPGQSGLFYGNATSVATVPVGPPTGSLSTNRYLTVVPLLPPGISPVAPDPSGTYTTPSAPLSLTAEQNGIGVPQINVSFLAPTSDGSVTPILKYQYSTNATDVTPTWRDFDTVTAGPPGPNVLTVDSAGNPFTLGNTYQVAVRAVNALGGGTASNVEAVLLEDTP